MLRRLAAVETGMGAGVADLRRRWSRVGAGVGSGIGAGPAETWREEGRDKGRELSMGTGSGGGAGPRRVSEGRRERAEAAVGLRLSLGEVVGDGGGLGAFTGEGAGAARGTAVVVVVVVTVAFIAGFVCVVFRFFTDGLGAERTISQWSWLFGCGSAVDSEAASIFLFLGAFAGFSLSKVNPKPELDPLPRGASFGFWKRFLKLLPISPSLFAASCASAAARAAASLANSSFLSFLASFSFIPLLLSFDSYPSESALISPGTSCLPGAVVAMLSQSINSSPVSSHLARIFR